MLSMDPTQRPTIEQVLGHPWLTQGEEASPSLPPEALPQLPDPDILKSMTQMGFDHYHTWVSVASRKFDHAMATYLLLKNQRSQREEAWAAVQVEPEGLPGPEDAPRVSPKRCPSEPALPLPREQQQPEDTTQSPHEAARRASLPAMRLRFLQMDTPPPGPASQPPP
ncbi:sperm motility kinase Z-like protein, partial [Leptotrombidium deliense]